MSAIETEAPPIGALGAATATTAENPAPALETLGAGSPMPGRRGLKGRRRPGYRWVSPLVVLVIWQLTHVFKLIDPNKLPPPSMVVTTAYNLAVHPIPAFGSLQAALLASVERFGMGFAAGGRSRSCWRSPPASAASAMRRSTRSPR